MKPCRDCGTEVSESALQCPKCGAIYPYKEKWDGYGYEYKSKATIMGIPLIHISFKYKPNFLPVPARGIIAIGQFGAGVINISQFGVGVLSVSQITISAFALCQIGVAYSLIAQMGLYWEKGYGQIVMNLKELLF
ncbi:MAG: zinc-ribbon domain-containing protein [Acidobacteria bacterium]|nr:zinc-ribbon domain-containing protein [Acidobacteriota bacterium]